MTWKSLSPPSPTSPLLTLLTNFDRSEVQVRFQNQKQPCTSVYTSPHISPYAAAPSPKLGLLDQRLTFLVHLPP